MLFLCTLLSGTATTTLLILPLTAASNPRQMFAVKVIQARTLQHPVETNLVAVAKEAEVLTRLSHPHVVRFFKIMIDKWMVTVDDETFPEYGLHIIMEFAEGGSLADVIKAKSVPETEQVVATPPISFVFIRLYSLFSTTFFEYSRLCSRLKSAEHFQMLQDVLLLLEAEPAIMVNHRLPG